MYEAMVRAGASPQWVLEDMRLSMFMPTYRAYMGKQHDEWERMRLQTVIVARSNGAKMQLGDLPNPYAAIVADQSEEADQPTAQEIRKAKEKLRKLKYGSDKLHNVG